MLLILLLLFFTPSHCRGEQILRETWTSVDGHALLYRIADETSLAEASIKSENLKDCSLGVLILESESFQAGSFQPSGIWKFSAMSQPVQESILRQSHGLIPDRSDNSLSRPAAAVYNGFGGGAMIQGREDLMQYSLWQSLQTGIYTPLTLGFSHTHMEFPQEKEDEWFHDPALPGQNFYYAAADFRGELPFSSFHFLTAGSFSGYMAPGISLMPVCTLFFRQQDLTVRYWYNSDHWVNRNLERAEWTHYGDAALNLFNLAGLGFSTETYWGRNDSDLTMERGISFKLIGESGFRKLSIGYAVSESREEGTGDVRQDVDASLARKTGYWSIGCEGGIRFDPDRIREWQAAGSVTRRHRRYMTSTVKVACDAEPGVLAVHPVLEESFRLGIWTFRTSGGFLAEVPGDKDSFSHGVTLKIQLQWGPW